MALPILIRNPGSASSTAQGQDLDSAGTVPGPVLAPARPTRPELAPPVQPAERAWLAKQPDRPPRSSEEAFIFALVEPAQESQRATGVPASVTIAQAILETYWGTSFLARTANNYFGIKAHTRPGSDGVVWIDAWEVEDDRNVVREEPFRKYLSVVESLIDHGRFFLENSRYRRALEARDDAREFARRINAAGYATDPGYAAKLISYMDRYDLYQYDVQLAP